MTVGISKILVCGTGLAFEFIMARLSNDLPKAIDITAIEIKSPNDTDILYGTVTSPDAYGNHLKAGLSEPELVTLSSTAFSYGTRYKNWGNSTDWVQCFQLPFPIRNGIQFHHFLTSSNLALEPFMPGAIAGRAGRFAHPPPDPNIILSRAEYGYQLDPTELSKLLKSKSDATRINRKQCQSIKVETGPKGIEEISTSDGEVLMADLYIDATGPNSILLSELGSTFESDRNLTCLHGSYTAPGTGGPLRIVTATQFGYTAITPLQKSNLTMHVCVPEDLAEVIQTIKNPGLARINFSTGQRNQAWIKNCVGIGHSIAMVEPLSPAPNSLLYRDIERLVSLIPTSNLMHVEAREYNRRFREDFEHVHMFNHGLLLNDVNHNGRYWKDSNNLRLSAKLSRRIEQFANRGLCVSYDLEPFNEQDWVIQHFGMGRRPQSFDRSLREMNPNQIANSVHKMKKSIDELVLKMPPHDRYIENMKRYLEKRK